MGEAKNSEKKKGSSRFSGRLLSKREAFQRIHRKFESTRICMCAHGDLLNLYLNTKYSTIDCISAVPKRFEFLRFQDIYRLKGWGLVDLSIVGEGSVVKMGLL